MVSEQPSTYVARLSPFEMLIFSGSAALVNLCTDSLLIAFSLASPAPLAGSSKALIEEEKFRKSGKRKYEQFAEKLVGAASSLQRVSST